MRFSIRRLLAVAGALVVPAVAHAQATITGRVTAEGGTPVAGASVFLEGLQIGAQTADDGRYNILVPAARATGQAATLSVRSIGYRPISQPVTLTPGATITRDFALAVNPLRLGEVVVTGAGTTSTRERIGSTVNSIDSTLLRRSNEPGNVVSALAGKAPNVEIRTQSGEPGSSASIRIRGASSVLGTNQPVFVVDNQPIDNSALSTGGGNQSTVTQNRAADINPNDIESIEVLKGAAASALYGARGANGVVLITTKRGRAGQTRYSLQSTTTMDNVDPRIDLQREFGQGATSAAAPNGAAFVCTAVNCRPTPYSFGPAIPAGTATFDHDRDIYDTGLTTDNNLSISGGTERTTFYLSGGLLNQNGFMRGPNNEYDRVSVRLKGTHQLLSRLNVGGNFSYIDTRGAYVQKGSNTSGLLLGSLRTPPDFDNRNYIDEASGLHRSYRFPRPGFNSLQLTRGYDNPFFTLNNPGNRSELGRFIGNVNADWTPLEWLRFQYTLGADSYADTRTEALPFTSSTRPTGQVIRYDITNLQIDHNLLATASRTFSEAFTGRLSLGQNLNSRRNRQIFVQGQDLNAPSPLVLQNTINPTQPTETKSLSHIEGYFAQAEADLFDQLFLTARVRNDGYSTFGPSNRRATYPAATVAWTFTKLLGTDDDTGILNFGKLRAAYGEVGREPPLYATSDYFSATSQFGSGYGDFVNISQSGAGGLITSFTQGNIDLEPERNRETEVGFDLGLFGQRADVGFTWYDKQSDKVILQVPTSAAQTGFLNTFANAAEISNKGIELTLNLRPVRSENFAWDIGLQYGRNRGKVESLAGTEAVTYNTEGFTGAIGSSTVGYAPGVIRGQDYARCGLGLQIDLDGDNVSEDIDGLCGAGATKGALFIGDNGQPISDPTERVIADPNPDWTGGLSTSITLFKRLRISGLLDTRQGGEVWNGTRGILYNFGTHGHTRVRTEQGIIGKGGNWLTDDDVAGPGAGTVAFTTPREWQAYWNGVGGGFGDVGRQFIEDGSFVKLRELSASYTLDQRWVRDRLGFSSVDFRVAGRNLATWTDYTGLDPEANLGGSEFFTQGLDYFNNPQARSFVLSFTLNR